VFQNHLQKHYWMFGSEYLHLLQTRKLTRNQQMDFVLRRVDGFLELIEIKTPLNGEDLFQPDSSHASLYPGTELSKGIGQVIHYISKVEANKKDILIEDGEQVDKIRAKLIIGRDNNKDQLMALRELNSHLHRIEILTFDQLLRTARRAL
jgi:Domain of unknown function (DUF4263)